MASSWALVIVLALMAVAFLFFQYDWLFYLLAALAVILLFYHFTSPKRMVVKKEDKAVKKEEVPAPQQNVVMIQQSTAGTQFVEDIVSGVIADSMKDTEEIKKAVKEAMPKSKQ